MNDAQLELATELGKDERLLWSGMPRQGIVFRGSDAFLILFSLLWGGFAIAWEVGTLYVAWSSGEPFTFIFPVFGVPFVLIGLYMIVGRFWVDSRARARTYYGVTNRRIIILSGRTTRKITSLDLRTLSDVSLTERSNGSGTITFGPMHPFMRMYGGLQWPGMSGFMVPSFELIDDARRVYTTILDAKNSE